MSNLRAALVNDVEQAHEALQAKLAAMPEADWARASANDGWSNKDLLAHLASIEERMRGQVPCAFGREPWPRDTIDEYNDRKIAELRDRTVQQLRDLLERETTATMTLLKGLSNEDLAHRFEHPRRGDVSLDDWLRIIPNHIHSHLADFRSA